MKVLKLTDKNKVVSICTDSIYKHYKGGLYKVIDIVYHHELNIPEIVYFKCTINGIFVSIKNDEGDCVGQPFERDAFEFIEKIDKNKRRFEFVKHINYK